MSLADTLKSLSGAASEESAFSMQGLLPHVLEMFGQGGGLSSLVHSFEQGGMGNIVNSWVGTGKNLPVTPDQVQAGLGRETINQLAERCGLSAEAVQSNLSQMLPRLVDSLTPNGHTGDSADLVSQGKAILTSLLTRRS